MFCNNCGANNPDGASFCNVCGSRLAVPTQNQAMPQYNNQAMPQYNNQAMPQYNNQAMPQQNYTPPNVAAPKKKKNMLIVAIIVIVALLAILAGTMAPAIIQSHKIAEKEKLVNDGKGADNPVEIAQAYMMCLNYGSPSYMNNYYDENWDGDKGNNTLMTVIENDIVGFREQGYSDINLEGVKYQTSVEYLEDGNTCIDVNVDFAETGLFGGNTWFGDKGSVLISMHKADTPQGEKWFLGR